MARDLIERFWGAYLYVGCDARTATWAVMSDPSGLLPVYWAEHGDGCLFASDPALLGMCARRVPGVSWSAVRAHLLRPELRQRQTCLEGITELIPGALLSVGAKDPPLRLWHAPDRALSSSQRTFEENAEELRHIAAGVVGRWGKQLGYVAVASSGGVDSSLICGAGAIAGISFGCVSLATLDPSGDERVYARAVAEACRVPFTERMYDPALFDPAQAASAGLPRPGRRAFLSVLDAALGDAMAELGADVVLDGNGGDNIFCFLHSAAPVVDRLRAQGLRSGFTETLLDTCRITGCTISTMLGATARRLVARTGDPWPADATLLAVGAEPRHPDPLTAWLPEPGEARRGWQDHMQLIMRSQNQIHGTGTCLPRFSPLASQPIVEFCLSVPTWQWTRGGRNRALARAAFSDVLPNEVLARTSKAGPDSLTRAAFARNRTAISERLMEGLLAKSGVIDRNAVLEALGCDPFHSASPVRRLLDLLEAENWARSWHR